MSIDRANEVLPVLPHLGSEFMLWLWYESEQTGGHIEFTSTETDDEVELGAPSSLDLWVDERIALRQANDTRVSAVLTGENPSATLESRAALAGGKVLHELRIGIRENDREFYITLKGPGLWPHSAALPMVVSGGTGYEALLDRLALVEEMDMLIGLLFNEYCARRLSDDWAATYAPMRLWVIGADDGGLPDLDDLVELEETNLPEEA